MRIAIVIYGNVYKTPYLPQYLDLIDSSASVDIIFWNRELKQEQYEGANLISFDCFADASPMKRLIGYIGFRRFVIKRLKKVAYDRVVVSPTFTALMLNSFLYRTYKKKYVLDIRDYGYEKYWIVRYWEKKLIESALAVVISSDGYRSFLPDGYDYVLVHNNRKLDASDVAEVQARPKDRSPLKVSFIGFVNYHDQQKRIMKLFKNDPRFILSFVGFGSAPLREFCKEEDIDNVEILDEFKPSEIMSFYRSTDIVNGIYGPNTPWFKYALSNKLYFAAELHLPMIVNKGTFTEEYMKGKGFVFGIDMDDAKTPDILYRIYRDVDWDKLDDGCDSFLETVAEDNANFERLIKTLLNEQSV